MSSEVSKTIQTRFSFNCVHLLVIQQMSLSSWEVTFQSSNHNNKPDRDCHEQLPGASIQFTENCCWFSVSMRLTAVLWKAATLLRHHQVTASSTCRILLAPTQTAAVEQYSSRDPEVPSLTSDKSQDLIAGAQLSFRGCYKETPLGT